MQDLLPTRSILCLLVTCLSAFVQAENIANSSQFKSAPDELLTIKRVAVLPIVDNVGGIYSRPLEEHLIETVDKQHRFELSHSRGVGNVMTPTELQENTEATLRLAQNLDADAFFSGKVVKGPNGISLSLSLFLSRDGKLLAESELKDSQKFDVNDLKAEMTNLFNDTMKKVPYNGLILSRQGERVTVNVGKLDGIQQDQVVSVIQIIKLNRHPKFNFLISTEKEIIGKVKLVKIEDTLSFGRIISEVERNAVQKNAKVIGLDQVKYADDASLNLSESKEDITTRPDAQISFGKNPSQWVPKKSPTFGAITAKMGIGSFTANMRTTSKNLTGNSSVYPYVGIGGELWVNNNWSMLAHMRQGIVTFSNPTSTGPDQLSMATSYYDFMFSRVFRTGPDVWGPKAEVMAGLANYRSIVDDTGDGFTSVTYSGIKMAVGGQMPVTKERDWRFGAYLNFFLTANLNEEPRKSGRNSKSSINQFSIDVAKRLGVNLMALGSIDIDLYASTFSGRGSGSVTATSVSQRHITAGGGIAYLF